MGMLLICVIIIIFGAAVHTVVEDRKRRKAVAERRKDFVERTCKNARIIVNNGVHFFYVDDENQTFGLDESGKMYSFSGLMNVSVYDDGIGFFHEDSTSLCVGKDYSHQDTTVALDPVSIAAIAGEMIPVLRKNLYKELEQMNITPTHEYVHAGEIWGCDINTRKFYNTSGCVQIHNFSVFRRVVVEDLSNNSLCKSNYIMHVYIENDNYGEWEYEIYFLSRDTTFYNLLAMFDEIKRRR